MPQLARLAWDDLRVVLEVARQGSIYAAAKIMKVDHSTVTRRIAHVELILERRLFDRSNRGITPRPETEHLLEHIRSMEMHAAAMHEELERNVATQVRAIRVATMEGLASGYLARRIQEITLDEPGIRIELFSNPHIVDLLKKETDIFLSFFDPMIPGLISEQIGETAIYLYGSARYQALHGLPGSREELGAHRYVGYIPEMVSIESVRWLDQLVPNAHLAFCSNSVIAQRNAAIAGAGLAVLPTFVGDETGALFRVLPDQIRSLRPVWMSVARDQHVLKTISRSAKAIARIFAADRPFLLGDSPWIERPAPSASVKA
ncbi:MAG: LysR family transcriptional regulator [Rhizobiales bacterium]|nr:LysR family transcriptional regulator [Hyphomicrobiales bacterium]